MRRLGREPCVLLVLLQSLDDRSVCQDAPVQQQKPLAMEVNELVLAT